MAPLPSELAKATTPVADDLVAAQGETPSADATKKEAATTEPESLADKAGLSQEGSGSGSVSEGEVDESEESNAPPLPSEAPPLPAEELPTGPPLPSEPVPGQQQQQQEDDGWDCQWDPTSQGWFFYNRFTGLSQWDNPRVASAADPASAPGTNVSAPLPPAHEKPVAGGYNPAIHGDYDPTAWYAKSDNPEPESSYDPSAAAAMIDPYASAAAFNRFTGQFQAAGEGAERHTDEAKSHRQMNAFFDVDAAANSHDGRSLKAERSNKKPSKQELKAFKEKRKARKEEKRRAWLRD